MADSKVTALSALTSTTIEGVDLFYVIDDPGGTPISKKIIASDVAKYVLNSSDFVGLETFYAFGAGKAGQTGTRNIGLGNRVLESITSGVNNVAIGQQALGAVTDGDANTAYGVHAALAVTSGNNNVAIGVDCYREGTGSNNTAVGHDAMFGAVGLSTGSNNVAMGKNAMISWTTGNNNTVIGYSAAQALTTGSTNVLIGKGCGSSVVSAINNVAVGTDANLGGTGNGNTTIGTQAGFGLTTGANNVIVGFCNVSASWNAITTGSGNVMIGNSVAVASATASNQLCISNYIYGTGMSGTGATISPGKIGIGKKAPDYNLDVAGTFGIAPGASVTPANNGDVVFELTSNTSLTIKAKGSDGTVRSVVLTLA